MIYTARNACAINTAGVWRGGRDIDRSIRGEVLKGRCPEKGCAPLKLRLGEAGEILIDQYGGVLKGRRPEKGCAPPKLRGL